MKRRTSDNHRSHSRRRRPARPGTHSHQAPHLRLILSEAWRNFSSGSTKAFWFALAFMLLVGSLAVTQTRIIVDFVNDALEFRTSGAATMMLSMQGSINGAQCDALASMSGIVASGALRQGEAVTFSTLPSMPIDSYESTPGFAHLLELRAGSDLNSSGVWMASDLADRLGIAKPISVALKDETEVLVTGVYEYPSDGRSPRLAYQVIAPVPATGNFDECWVMAWPDPGLASQTLTLSMLPQVSGGEQQIPTTGQLNTTLGTEFHGPARFAELPLGIIQLAAIGVGSALGFIAVWVRRLEFAAILHAGLSKPALGIQMLIESTIWTAFAAVPVLALSLWTAKYHNTLDWFPAWYIAARTLVLSAIAALLGGQLGVALTREAHLFRYFKNR